MYLDPQSTLTLYKVNLQLYFRLCDLMRENALRWSEAGNRSYDTCAAELENAATRMLDASDWTSLGGVTGDFYWKAVQLQTDVVQQMAEAVLGNQSNLSSATQDALSTWQKDAAATLKETTGAMPISTTLQDYFQDYLHLLSTAAPGSPRKPSSRKAH